MQVDSVCCRPSLNAAMARVMKLNSHLRVEQMSDAGAECFGTGREAASPLSKKQSRPERVVATSRRPSREQATRLAVVSLFSDPVPEQCSRLFELSTGDWEKLMRWLDVSGLALYFLDRLTELKLSDLLPPAVFTRMCLNLIDNTERTRQLLLESGEIQKRFQKTRISYAVLKGISLWPDVVSKPELRLQFDLDYLVAEEDIPSARTILEQTGYRLYAVSGRTSEFKKNERPGISLKHIYKHFDSYGVELHSTSGRQDDKAILGRVHWRHVSGISMPVLDPIDLFLGHGLHTFKHLCGEYARASQYVEFRRHVLRHHSDRNFWQEVQLRTRGDRRTRLGLGVVVYLISHVLGEFAPAALSSWTANDLPDGVRLWVHTHGLRVILGSYPGTKLYLLLQQELEKCGIEGQRSTRNILLPRQLPPVVIKPVANENFGIRIRRYVMNATKVVERARFHVVEGLRFALEARRWRRLQGRQAG